MIYIKLLGLARVPVPEKTRGRLSRQYGRNHLTDSTQVARLTRNLGISIHLPDLRVRRAGVFFSILTRGHACRLFERRIKDGF